MVSLLEEFVLERGIDLLVLGARGQSALAEMLIGSTATRILLAAAVRRAGGAGRLPRDLVIIAGAGS